MDTLHTEKIPDFTPFRAVLRVFRRQDGSNLLSMRKKKTGKLHRYATIAAETTIAPEEIITLVKKMNELREKGRDPNWYSAVGILSDQYRGDPLRCFSILERMRCMADLSKDRRMRGWSMEGAEEGCLLTDEAIFHPTALCTLRQDGKKTWFDPEEFFRLVLTHTESGGSA